MVLNGRGVQRRGRVDKQMPDDQQGNHLGNQDHRNLATEQLL